MGVCLEGVGLVHVGLGSQRATPTCKNCTPRNYEESIGSQLFQENSTPQMDHPGSQQPLFNQNAQGIPLNP